MSTLLRLCTAGSVDDGKSTLIGRLLYEARAVYEDQLSSVKDASRNRGAGPIDFSLFTDGLKAERVPAIVSADEPARNARRESMWLSPRVGFNRMRRANAIARATMFACVVNLTG